MSQDETSAITSVGPMFWLLAKITILLQVGVLVHVVRSGRPYWWAFIIFGFPILGSLAYIYFEVLPDRRLPSIKEISWKLKGPDGRIAALEFQLAEVDTMNNRMLLARELSLSGRFPEAAQTLHAGISSAHMDDGYVIYQYAQALIDSGEYANGEQAALQVVLKDAKELATRRDLLLARASAGLGRIEEADRRYQALLPFHPGEAARGHYARMLAACSRVAEARRLWEEVLKKYRQSTSTWRRSEKAWFTEAKAGLKRTRPPSAG